MVHLKATAIGLVTAVIFGAVWLWAALQLPIWWQMWKQRNQGGGAATSNVGSGSVLLVVPIGFALGFFWIVRSASN